MVDPDRSTSYRLFFKSLLISLVVIIPLYLVLFYTLVANRDTPAEQPAANPTADVPISADSATLFVVVTEPSGSEPLLAAALRFDVAQNRVTATVIPVSALPRADTPHISSGGIPSRWMEKAMSLVKGATGVQFSGYLAFTTESLEALVNTAGSFSCNITSPITASDGSGKTIFHIDAGTAKLNGGSAAAVIRYSTALGEQKYCEEMAALLNSALVEYLSHSNFADDCLNWFYGEGSSLATDIGAGLANSLHKTARSAYANRAAVDSLVAAGYYRGDVYVLDSSLADKLS